MASVSSRKPNATAGAQDAPAKIDVRFSITPKQHRGDHVPGKLPMPPSTAMAKTRPMKSRPIDGSTGSSTSSSAPAAPGQRDGDGEGDTLQAHRVGAHEAQSRRVLGDAQNCAAQ